MAKKKWADVRDKVLGAKGEKKDEEDEAVEVSTKGKPKKATARRSVVREEREQVKKVPAAVRNARPALGRQSHSKAWTYSD